MQHKNLFDLDEQHSAIFFFMLFSYTVRFIRKPSPGNISARYAMSVRLDVDAYPAS